MQRDLRGTNVLHSTPCEPLQRRFGSGTSGGCSDGDDWVRAQG